MERLDAFGTEGDLQHYFHSRGVARVYRMSFARGVWKLLRTSAHLWPLDFSQRFGGSFSEDGATIEGGRSSTTALAARTTSTGDTRGSRSRGHPARTTRG
jgi:hypothetical protein